MKKFFICSLCHNGLIGGAIFLEPESVTYSTQKLTVDKRFRKLVLPMHEIREITWKWVVFPVATFHMINGENYTFMIFNKARFSKYFLEFRGI
jgi:hypothetical protein